MNKWTLCKDKLPEKSGTYIVCGKTKNVYVLKYDATIKRWYGGTKIVAWMPLPEAPDEA